jgi:hypothetical protein
VKVRAANALPVVIELGSLPVLRCAKTSQPRSPLGHLRPGRAGSKSGDGRYAPIATKFRIRLRAYRYAG